jgi:hypothetical protein
VTPLQFLVPIMLWGRESLSTKERRGASAETDGPVMMHHLGRTEECNVSCKPDTREPDPFVTSRTPVTKPLGPTRETIDVGVETLAAIATQASMLLDPFCLLIGCGYIPR